MIAPATGKAFAVLFQDLVRWDVGFFRQVSWKWPEGTLKPLGSVLSRVISPVPRAQYTQGLQIIDKITFGGRLLTTDLPDEKAYKGRLFRAAEGNLIYSKIRLKQGSLAVVSQETGEVAVSSEYPVYAVDDQRALPAYLVLVLRSRSFQSLLAGISHGGSTKTRIHPDDFECLTIPLPCIETQRAIVDHSQEAEEALADARIALAEPVKALNARLLDFYHHETAQDVIHSRFFALDFKDVEAWDVKSGRAAAFRLACPSFRPMSDFVEEVTETVRPFDDPDHDWPVYGVNNKDGVFLNSKQKGRDFNAPYKRIRQDWFFHNPTRCNVGSLGIVPEVAEDAITSPEYQVWRVKLDAPDPMLPGFVAVLIQTPFFIDLVQFNRVGAVKQRMYTENLCQLRVPYVPVSEQEKYARAREKGLATMEKARARLNDTRADVEAMILGTKPVPKTGKKK